jgi:hypothetical protein
MKIYLHIHVFTSLTRNSGSSNNRILRQTISPRPYFGGKVLTSPFDTNLKDDPTEIRPVLKRQL